MAIIRKITTGDVIQVFDTETNKFTSQEFVAGDVEYEDEFGEGTVPTSEVKSSYLEFNMIQP